MNKEMKSLQSDTRFLTSKNTRDPFEMPQWNVRSEASTIATTTTDLKWVTIGAGEPQNFDSHTISKDTDA